MSLFLLTLTLISARGIAGNDFVTINAPTQQLAEQALLTWQAVLTDRASKNLPNPQHKIVFHWVTDRGNNLFVWARRKISVRMRHIVWVECPPDKLREFVTAAVLSLVAEEQNHGRKD